MNLAPNCTDAHLPFAAAESPKGSFSSLAQQRRMVDDSLWKSEDVFLRKHQRLNVQNSLGKAQLRRVL
jgi:hypothetical protein